jgi:hypothetical protein
MPIRRVVILLLIVLAALLPGAATANSFPETIGLPDGFQPEGIASARYDIVRVG